MSDEPKVMRCSECRELFAAQAAAHVIEQQINGWTKNLMLCPVCRLKAAQRSIQEPPTS